MNASCCSFRRISRTRKMELRTTPVMTSGNTSRPTTSRPTFCQLKMIQPTLSASATLARHTPRTMNATIDLRRPPDVMGGSAPL
jgi:hypothetical protein